MERRGSSGQDRDEEPRTDSDRSPHSAPVLRASARQRLSARAHPAHAHAGEGLRRYRLQVRYYDKTLLHLISGHSLYHSFIKLYYNTLHSQK